MSSATRKRYALVGTGGRAAFFYNAVLHNFSETSELVAFCDTNQTRMDYANARVKACGLVDLPTFHALDFDKMIKDTKPEVVIVTSVDRTHNIYIVRAMELGVDVICEKPMTIDEVRCQQILDTVKITGRNLRMTFNYRYAPHNTKICELLRDGTIGKVNSVHFEWLLNTQHGADYFRRWHRDKRNSGGLLIHKSTHHFDLVNFWLKSQPETVFAMGDLAFYGRENAEKSGQTKFYARAHGSKEAKNDPFAIHLEANEQLKAMYLDAEHEDGYFRDQSVFGDGISIEDTMAVIVKYRSGTLLTYSLVTYAPYEGFRVGFNGSKGRLEATILEKSYVNSGGDQALEGALEDVNIVIHPMFAPPYNARIEGGTGGHGGGDPILLNDLFGNPMPDPLNRAASHIDGALSILTGIAANTALRSGQVVQIKDLVQI
jgi:predicted dehydrogenase